jgi:simple sugar transport system permease protein
MTKKNIITQKKILESLGQSASARSVFASIASIILGLIFGLIVLIFISPSDAFTGFSSLLTAGISGVYRFSKVLYNAAPLLMTGLAVGFAFKTGLFNIGAAGQFTMGGFFALYAGIMWKMPWWVCIIAALIGGAIWGAFPGIFKAFFNVNEVITSIMFNWIGLFFVDLVLSDTAGMLDLVGNKTLELALANGSAILPDLGLQAALGTPFMNIGFIIASAFAVIVYFVLEKTTFGYEIKACGLNRDASIYAGINAKRNIIVSMVISGALAGIGGALSYLSGTVQMETFASSLSPMGFNGIPVALLAFSSPLGIIASSFFIAYMQVGGEAMYPEYSSEMVNIIIAVIIYFSAFSLLMRQVIGNFLSSKKKRMEKALLDEGLEPITPVQPTQKEAK